MKKFSALKKNNCVNALFVVKGLVIPAINAVIITEAVQ